MLREELSCIRSPGRESTGVVIADCRVRCKSAVHAGRAARVRLHLPRKGTCSCSVHRSNLPADGYCCQTSIWFPVAESSTFSVVYAELDPYRRQPPCVLWRKIRRYVVVVVVVCVTAWACRAAGECSYYGRGTHVEVTRVLSLWHP